MGRFETVSAFASIKPDGRARVSVEACRLAVRATEIDEDAVLQALRAVERGEDDLGMSLAMQILADRFDNDASDARESGDEARYDGLFRRSRAVAAIAFALSSQPGEAIYEAAHAIGTPDDLVRLLRV